MSLRTVSIILLALTACVERPLDAEASATAANTTSTGTTGGEPPATATLPGTSTTPGDPSGAGTVTSDPTSDPTIGPTGDGHTSNLFLPGHDWGTQTECDTWTQDCPRGQKCMPYADDGGNSWNNLKCVHIVPDPAGLSEPCSVLGSGVSGEDTCDEGLMCWDVDPDTGQGTCLGLCTGNPDEPGCADPMASCVVSGAGVLNLCFPRCDPLAQDCLPGDLCLPNPLDADAFICVFDASGEGGQAFDPCEYANACDPGLLCLNPDLGVECDPLASGCCLPYCDTSLDPAPCPGQDQVCIPWYDPGHAPPGYENVGACGLAP